MLFHHTAAFCEWIEVIFPTRLDVPLIEDPNNHAGIYTAPPLPDNPFVLSKDFCVKHFPLYSNIIFISNWDLRRSFKLMVNIIIMYAALSY